MFYVQVNHVIVMSEPALFQLYSTFIPFYSPAKVTAAAAMCKIEKYPVAG